MIQKAPADFLRELFCYIEKTAGAKPPPYCKIQLIMPTLF